MRTKNSILNYTTGLILKLITLVLNFISRTVFIHTLGISYLGVHGLMTNVMSMLSIAELGIGSAITFSLYKPLAVKDTKKTILLMKFYKKAYQIIGIIILIIGFVLVFFIDAIIKDSGDVENIKFIFSLYIILTAFPYFINYKEALIKADQKEYRLATIRIIFTIFTVLSQIIVLLITKNFIVYLTTNILLLLVQLIYINRKITSMYSLLRVQTNEKLPKDEISTIISKIKAMIFHKIGGFSIHSTDNIIISAFISVKLVGLYSNYTMIINSINSFITLFFNSITASMGNLIATTSNAKKLEVFKVTNFIGFWIYCFSVISFLNLLNPTITLWLGTDYLIDDYIIWIVLLNFYLTGMRLPVETVKAASGLYEVDRYSPLIQSAINLVISIILVKKLGLAGVFLGSVISALVLPNWQRPYLVYKYVFKTSSKPYFITFIIYSCILMLLAVITYWFLNKYFVDYTLYNYIIRLLVCVLVPNVVIILIFRKTNEFKQLFRILISILKR